MSAKVPHVLQAYCGVGAEMRVTQPVVDMVFRKLGGREVLGQTVSSEADLARLVHGRIALRRSSMSGAAASRTKRSDDL